MYVDDSRYSEDGYLALDLTDNVFQSCHVYVYGPSSQFPVSYEGVSFSFCVQIRSPTAGTEKKPAMVEDKSQHWDILLIDAARATITEEECGSLIGGLV